MDNYRLILLFAVAFLSMMVWQQWQLDYGPKSIEESKIAYDAELKQTQQLKNQKQKKYYEISRENENKNPIFHQNIFISK